MKRTCSRAAALAAAALCLAWIGRAAADEVSIGDTEDRVRQVLGEPGGYIKSGSYQALLYDRGRVELRDGRVTEVELVSAEQAQLQKLQRERDRLARAEAEQARREALRIEGLAEKERMLADPVFRASAASEQLDFWRRFRTKYPDVEVDEAYAGALAAWEQERATLQQDQRLLDMEKRVAEAEARAREAERSAAAARDEAQRRVVYASPFVDYYYTPAPVVGCGPYYTPRYLYYPGYRSTSWRQTSRPSVVHRPPPCGSGLSLSYQGHQGRSSVGVRVGF